jgi:UDP-N-acetylmuramate dehydrogenase
MVAAVDQELARNGIKFELNADTARLSYIKIGAKVGCCVFPESEEQLRVAIQIANRNGMPWRVLGNVSNCIVGNGFSTNMLILTKMLNTVEFDVERKIARAGAGAMLPLFAKMAVDRGFVGFEGLGGIPGSIGGAVYMNAGAYGNEISDKLERVRVLDSDGEFKTIARHDLSFRFRYSNFQENKGVIVLAAEFRSDVADSRLVMQRMEEFRKNRRTYQENRFPNLGSLFRTRDIYSDIARGRPLYKMVLRVIRLLSRLLGSKDNRLLNFITTKWFGLRHAGRPPYSDKTLNCLVNRGDMTIEKAASYISWVKSLVGGEPPLEIEILE